MGNSDSQSASASNSIHDLRLDRFIRSDALEKLNEVRKLNPVLREAIDEPVQLRLVLDACIIQQELRFRLCRKEKPEARSALQEILDSGTVLPFAPPKLIEEIENHVGQIAIYARVTVDQVRQEWATLQNRIHFYEPEIIPDGKGSVDPDDLPYRQVCLELGAHAIYTKDAHFKSMQVPIITIDLDRVLRKHARASSIKLAVSVSSTFTLVISINVLKELLGLAKRGIHKIPTPVKVAFVAAVAAAFIYPRSRAKILEVGEIIWKKFNHPKFRAMLFSLAVQTAEAHQMAATTSREIQAALPNAMKRHAINFAREVCAIAKRPLTLPEIALRMKNAGYATKSRSFIAYLRRLLRGSKNFIEISPGYWTLKISTGRAA
jgi:predicted nucleic acid-binding protein